MFLVKIWDGNLNKTGDPDFRIADGFYSLEHQWDEGLIDVSGFSWEIDAPHGGMVSSKFGLLSFLPNIIPTDYIGVDIYYSNNGEDEAVLLFSGVGYINSRERTKLTYDLFTDTPNEMISKGGIDYSAGTTVLGIFQEYFERVDIGWTVNHDKYSATNKEVNAPDAGAGQLYSQFLSDLCQTYSCYFVLDAIDSVVYLRDIAEGVEGDTPVDLTGFEFFPSRYTYSLPPSRITVTDPADPRPVYNPPYYFGLNVDLTAFSDDSDLNEDLATAVMELYRDHPLQVEFFMPLEYFAEYGINLLTMNKFTWSDDSVLFTNGETDFETTIHNISFSVQKSEAVLSGYVTAS